MYKAMAQAMKVKEQWHDPRLIETLSQAMIF